VARSHVHLPEGFTLHAVTDDQVEAMAEVLRSEELALRGYSEWGVETAHTESTPRIPPARRVCTSGLQCALRAGMRVVNEDVVYEKELT